MHVISASTQRLYYSCIASASKTISKKWGFTSTHEFKQIHRNQARLKSSNFSIPRSKQPNHNGNNYQSTVLKIHLEILNDHKVDCKYSSNKIGMIVENASLKFWWSSTMTIEPI